MTEPTHEELRALCHTAPRGPYEAMLRATRYGNIPIGGTLRDGRGRLLAELELVEGLGPYLAALSPEVVLALLTENAELQQQLANQRTVADHIAHQQYVEGLQQQLTAAQEANTCEICGGENNRITVCLSCYNEAGKAAIEARTQLAAEKQKVERLTAALVSLAQTYHYDYRRHHRGYGVNDRFELCVVEPCRTIAALLTETAAAEPQPHEPCVHCKGTGVDAERAGDGREGFVRCYFCNGTGTAAVEVSDGR